MPTRSRLTLSVSPDFDLTAAVCSYGYFMLAPNLWLPEQRAFVRPLRTLDSRIVTLTLRQPKASPRAAKPGPSGPDPKRPRLRISADARLTPADRAHLRPQLTRMLRLDQSLTEFHKLHPQARRRRFGRLFRSPTFFEDVVKTITGCNTTWPLTTRMNLLLCQHVGQGAFPTPQEIASHTPAALQSLCKLGYRAGRIHDLATGILEGRHHLAALEDPTTPTDTLHAALLKLPGVGPYAAANLCQLLGRFDRLAIDSETYRHFRQVHHTPTPRSSAALRKLHRRIERHYARYAPYQFIAYWFELWRHYESRVGPARHWTSDHARHFTAASLRSP